jgi:leucyl aminopeptidase
MKLTFSREAVESVDADAAVYFVTKYDKIAGRELLRLESGTNGAVSKIMKSEEFTGEEGQFAALYRPDGYRAGRVILAGLGEAGKIDPDSFRRAMGRAARYQPLTGSRKVAVSFGGFDKAAYFQAAIEGFLLGSFKMLDYKTGKGAEDTRRLKELVFLANGVSALKKVEKAANRGMIIAEGQILARRLSAMPANDLTPTIYAEEARNLAKQYGFGCRVLEEQAIEKERMGAFLAVARGSSEPPRFIILKHGGGPENQRPIVLVGKGITFDTGGISLKPALNMQEMKGDMTGSAVVLSTVATAARLNIRRNLIGLIPTCENMPSSKATRPGDIVASRKGKTIEIINTDAEGRLILADALDYADKFNPQAVIDIATLTGASLYILGYAGAPVLGNNPVLLERIEKAAAETAENVWRLPIWDEHRELMKSEIADLVNSAGKTAGTIAASAFLENFIGEWPWAHIDIAYMDLEPKGKPYVPKGATGFGLRLLISLLSEWKRL